MAAVKPYLLNVLSLDSIPNMLRHARPRGLMSAGEVESSPSRRSEPPTPLIQCHGMPDMRDDRIVPKLGKHDRTQAAVRLDRVPGTEEVDRAFALPFGRPK